MDIALVTCSQLPTWEIDDGPLWAALERRGVRVHQPAWDADVDWFAFDAVVIRTTWDYWNRGDAFLAWIDRVAAHPRLFNPAPVLRWSLDKRYLAELAAAGVPMAETVWLAPGDRPDLRALLAERGWSRAFLKPSFGASASGTLRFSADDAGFAAADAHLRAHGEALTYLLQPYLETVETFGEVSAIVLGGVYSHGVRKVPVPGDYRVQDDYGASDAPYAFSPAERALCERALTAAAEILGLREPLLYARVDWLRGPDGRLLLTELELVEPSLFFRHGPAAAERMAELIVARVRATGPV
ncbi:MAG: hypothetical protein RIT45_1463 [Pseudomonadota bacterium]|jgi:hypothetical protein